MEVLARRQIREAQSQPALSTVLNRFLLGNDRDEKPSASLCLIAAEAAIKVELIYEYITFC